MWKKTHTHTHTHTHASAIEWLGWQDRIARLCAILQTHTHRMTRPDCAVMCNLINTHTHTHTHTFRHAVQRSQTAFIFHKTASSIFCITHDTCPLHTNSGRGKREAHEKWSLVKPEKATLVTGTTLRTTGPVPTDSRQGTPSVRNRVTRLIRDWPDGGWMWTPSRKAGGIPWKSTRLMIDDWWFSLSVENERADAGRDGRTRLAGPNSQARTGPGKKAWFLSGWPRAG